MWLRSPLIRRQWDIYLSGGNQNWPQYCTPCNPGAGDHCDTKAVNSHKHRPETRGRGLDPSKHCSILRLIQRSNLQPFWNHSTWWMHFTDIGDDNGFCYLIMSGIWTHKYQLSTDKLWKYDLNTIYHVHVGTSVNTCKIMRAKMSSNQLNLCQPPQLLSSHHPEWSTSIRVRSLSFLIAYFPPECFKLFQ